MDARAKAGRPSRDAQACLHDNPSRLVTQHHGINAARVADTALGEIMQIGATDTNRFHSHLNLARLRV